MAPHGPDENQVSRMLKAIGIEYVDALVADGHWPVDDNPLINAPHTARALADEWTHPYDRTTAAFPMGSTADKYWPPVGRIGSAHGDKNLVCSCPDIDNYR